MAVTTKLTADEFMALDDPRRGLQLIEGEVVVNQPRPLHQHACFMLAFALGKWAEAGEGRGTVSLPLDTKLDEYNVYAPDVLWFAPGRHPGMVAPPPFDLSDLAIEVRSPSTWRYDVGTKKRVYEAKGLRELWLVDTTSCTVLVFRRSKPGAPEFDVELEVADTLTTPLLPGLAIDVAALFRGP